MKYTTFIIGFKLFVLSLTYIEIPGIFVEIDKDFFII